MQITATFDIDPKNSDPDKIAESFDQYLRDMLYIGIDDDDVFLISDVTITEGPYSPDSFDALSYEAQQSWLRGMKEEA
jgi:hypothetical protein